MNSSSHSTNELYALKLLFVYCLAGLALGIALLLNPGSGYAESGGPEYAKLTDISFEKLETVSASADLSIIVLTGKPVYAGNMKNPSSVKFHGTMDVLDGNGNFLWRYPMRNIQTMFPLNAVVSDNASLIAAQLFSEPCGDVQEYTSGVLGDYYRYFCRREVALFNREGQLLWKRPGGGRIKISPDGKYIMVMPDTIFDTGVFKLQPASWQLFDLHGNLLAAKPIATEKELHEVLLLGERFESHGPFSKDGKYFLFANALWQAGKDKPEKLSITGLPETSIFTAISPSGQYAVAYASAAADFTNYTRIGSDENEAEPIHMPQAITWPVYLIDVPARKVLGDLKPKTMINMRPLDIFSVGDPERSGIHTEYTPILTDNYFVGWDLTGNRFVFIDLKDQKVVDSGKQAAIKCNFSPDDYYGYSIEVTMQGKSRQLYPLPQPWPECSANGQLLHPLYVSSYDYAVHAGTEHLTIFRLKQ